MELPPPTPESENGSRTSVTTVCLIVLTVCVGGATLTALRPVITPVLIGLFLFFLINPLAAFFDERRVPTWMTYVLIAIIAIMSVSIIGSIAQSQTQAFQER